MEERNITPTMRRFTGNGEKREIARKTLDLSDNRTVDIVEYSIEGYGTVEYAENYTNGNGDFRRSLSMMPFAYLDKRAHDFKWSMYPEDTTQQKRIANSFVFNFEKYKEAGKGLYIFSSTKGSGKTLLSCCLANEVLSRRDVRIKFISIPDLLEMTKKGFKDDKSREELEGIMKADVLIMDDIGVELKKDWVDTVLFRYIDHRYTRKLITIFTSNLKIDQLNLDDRIVDRMYEMCITLHLPEISIRRQQAEKGNLAFMSEL